MLYTDNPGGQSAFPELTGLKVNSNQPWNADPTLSPTPIPAYTSFMNIPDASLAGGGVSHYTLKGDYNISDPAYANYSMAYNTGIGQDNANLTFTGFSTLTVEMHMVWDASSGWAGTNLSGYQFIGMDLTAVGPGDESHVSAVYDYTLDVDGQPMPDTLHLSFADSNVFGGPDPAVKSVFLFDSGVLRPTDLAPASASGSHTLTMDATITFQVKDPFEPTFSKLFPRNTQTVQAVRDFLTQRIDPSSSNPQVFEIFSLQGGGVGDYFINNPDQGGKGEEPGRLSSGAVGIPEPSGLALMFVGAAVMLRRRGR
ncbi:MAG: PEP-CTERM sorting domain-containing protein [Planctomycetota bacterium]